MVSLALSPTELLELSASLIVNATTVTPVLFAPSVPFSRDEEGTSGRYGGGPRETPPG